MNIQNRSYPETSIFAVSREIRSGKAALAAGRPGAFLGQGKRGQCGFPGQPLGAESLLQLCGVVFENTYHRYALFKYALLSCRSVLSGGHRGFGIASSPSALLFSLGVLFLSACSASDGESAATTASGGGQATIFREHQITDPGMGNHVAATFLVPEGWETKGGMTRPDARYFSIPYLLDVVFTAPDGRSIHFFPSLSFEFSNQGYSAQPLAPTANGNMYLPLPASPGQWIQNMAQMYPDPEVSNLRVVSETPEPEITRQLQQQNQYSYQNVQQLNAMGMQTGVGAEFDTQATVVVLQYEKNGRALEESILIAWQYYLNYFQGQPSGGYWGISFMYSLGGPAGSDYLNDPQLAAIAQSMRPDPAWVNEMNKHYAAMANIRARGAADRQRQNAAAQRKLSQTLSETSDIIAGGWAKRSAIQEAGHANYIDSVHEVTPYTTPSGETVKLPSFYENVYTDNNGRYILANDAFYNPNQDAAVNNQDWTRIDERK